MADPSPGDHVSTRGSVSGFLMKRWLGCGLRKKLTTRSNKLPGNRRVERRRCSWGQRIQFRVVTSIGFHAMTVPPPPASH